MAYKPMKIKETWDYRKVDQAELQKQVKRARHYLNQVELNVQRGSILVDLDYGEVFDAVEQIYQIADIGKLAADNAERYRKEQAELKRKGLKV